MPLHTHNHGVICGSEKKRALIFVEKCGPVGEMKNVGKTRGENMGFKTTFAKSSYIVLHDNESFRPQKLNIKIKE